MIILFDTDIGLGTPRAELDDGAAIVFLLRALGDKVAGVTAVHGNASLESAMNNSRRLLAELFRADGHSAGARSRQWAGGAKRVVCRMGSRVRRHASLAPCSG